MSDLISRQAALKKFTYSYKGERIPDYDCDNFPTQISFVDVRKVIRELPSVEPESKWIPVSERLPEDGRPVLIYAWNVHHVVARYDIFRTETGYKKCWVTADAWNGNTEIKHAVIAWMPLPKPYKAESEEV